MLQRVEQVTVNAEAASRFGPVAATNLEGGADRRALQRLDGSPELSARSILPPQAAPIPGRSGGVVDLARRDRAL